MLAEFDDKNRWDFDWTKMSRDRKVEILEEERATLADTLPPDETPLPPEECATGDPACDLTQHENHIWNGATVTEV